MESQHRTLQLLYDLYALSPSRGTVINDKRDLSFQGQADLIYTGVPGLKMDDKELSDSEKLKFIERFTEFGIKWSEFIDLAYHGDKHLSICGNVFVLYRERTVAGVKRGKIEVLDCRDCVPLKTSENEADAILWTPDFFTGDIRDYEVYNVYPYYKQEGRERTTVFHWKLNNEGVWGRPSDEQAIRWMIAEAMIALKETKVSSTDLVSKILLLMEEEETSDFADGIQSFKTDETNGVETESSLKLRSTFRQKVNALRALTTVEGDNAKALAALQYPYGTKSPEVVKLDVSRDSAYLESITQIASSHIYQANSWSKELTGFTQSKGGIGANLLKDLFQWKYITKLQPRQEWWARNISELWSFMFQEEVENSIKYPNLIENLNLSEEEEEIQEDDDDNS